MSGAQARIMRDGRVLYKIYLHRAGFPGAHLAPGSEEGRWYWLAFGPRHAERKARRKLAAFERRQQRRSQVWTLGGGS